MQQQALLDKLLSGSSLSSPEMEFCIEGMMTGEFSDIVISALLALLQKKGFNASELSSACRALMAKAVTIRLDEHAVDTCGTGGDKAGTFNISTIAAFISCGAGAPIAKHGNRSITSRCGSADVLEALGYDITLPPESTIELFRQTGFAFLFAPIYHPSMKAVAHIRRELGIKTIFNALGPLVNPAGVRRQVIGVYDESLLDLYTETLRQNGSHHALVIHGHTETGAGIDEASVCGVSRIAELQDGEITYHSVYPEEFGLGRWTIGELKGGDREENALIIRQILDGSAPRPQIDAALYASAIACYASGIATCIDEGMSLSKESLESGNAQKKFRQVLSVNREITSRRRSSVN